jgi:FRG domain
MSEWHEFAAFMEAVGAARSNFPLLPHQDCFFRGHRDATYKLQPSLFRQGNKNDDEYWQLERRIFFEFRNRARQLYQADYTGWDVLFHMQHHGVPTRLLDWTSVFGIALYFAVLNYRDGMEQMPCVWLLNPYALNYETWRRHRLFNTRYLARDESKNRSFEYSELLLDTHPEHWGTKRLDWVTPLALYEHQRSERMFAQSGLFTIHGTDSRAIDDIFGDRADILKRVDVPKAAIPAVREFLAFAGIGHRQLFPDLDGLARSICDQFGIMR